MKGLDSEIEEIMVSTSTTKDETKIGAKRLRKTSCVDHENSEGALGTTSQRCARMHIPSLAKPILKMTI